MKWRTYGNVKGSGCGGYYRGDPGSAGFIGTKEGCSGKACHELNSHGLQVHAIQGIHCNLPEYTDVYQSLADDERLTVRVYLGYDELPGCHIRTGLGDEMVKYGFYKLYVDGNMGGRTALLFSPYSDDIDSMGSPIIPRKSSTRK